MRKLFRQHGFEMVGIVVEVIGIFASILLAFALENWNEAENNKEKERVYLRSLYSDLVKDANELERRILEYERKMNASHTIMATLAAKGPYDLDAVLAVIGSDLTYNYAYSPHNNTYKSLESSGDLKFITNSNFKILLYELDKSFQTTTMYGNLFLDYTNSELWAGFLINHVNQITGHSLHADWQKDQQFRILFYNRILRLHRLIEVYYYNMQGTLKKIQEVKMALQDELKANDIIIDEEEVHNVHPDDAAAQQSADSTQTEEVEDLLKELEKQQ